MMNKIITYPLKICINKEKSEIRDIYTHTPAFEMWPDLKGKGNAEGKGR